MVAARGWGSVSGGVSVLGGQTRRQKLSLSLHGFIDVLDVFRVRDENHIAVQQEDVVFVQEGDVIFLQ